jgi:zinc D-Ala-D-Ala carboxypeptidase
MNGCIQKIFCIIFFVTAAAGGGINLDRLSDIEIKKTEAILAKLTPVIEQKRQTATLATLTFAELYKPLNKKQKDFLKSFEKLDANELGVKIRYRGAASGKEELVKITGQKVKDKDKTMTLPPQFLPKDVYQSYTAMMDAMKKDIGKRLYVESGYRSAAYQLYLFIFYLKNHSYSIRQTSKFIALPGYSEHGDPKHQAIDFVNEDGIDGQNDPQAFEVLEEYKWLTQNAYKFGFVLSYPKDSKDGITFEPWHWRYEKSS